LVQAFLKKWWVESDVKITKREKNISCVWTYHKTKQLSKASLWVITKLRCQKIHIFNNRTFGLRKYKMVVSWFIIWLCCREIHIFNNTSFGYYLSTWRALMKTIIWQFLKSDPPVLSLLLNMYMSAKQNKEELVIATEYQVLNDCIIFLGNCENMRNIIITPL
jgi:hypothetical protein